MTVATMTASVRQAPQPLEAAPDESIVEMGRTLRARMQARAAGEALQ